MNRAIPTSSALGTTLVFIMGGASTEARAAVGGPDAFGYTFVDQDDGATFGYVDIRTTGTLLVSADESLAATVLGAPFAIYGVAYGELEVSTNGFLGGPMMLSPDFTNDCPLPAAPGGGAGSFRIAAFHDDLVTAVYYQYFDEVAAAAVGYPGEVEGISVFQWYGTYFGGGGDALDAEVILFHDDDTILSMVAVDDRGGSGSTMGIQNMDATIGLTYRCNEAGSVLPGVTAVEYTPGVPPDSDCCTPSPTNAPGCTNPTCRAAVCDVDSSCCTTAWTVSCADLAAVECALLCGAPAPLVTINEVRVDHDGFDTEEYFELVGDPATSLNGLQYVVLGDFPTGEVEEVIDLTGLQIPPSAFFVGAEASFTLSAPDLVTPLNFEDDDTVTHLLVGGFSGSIGDNLDPNGDGVLDSTPWLALLDAVSIVAMDGGDQSYAHPPNCMPSATCQEIGTLGDTPNHIFRCGNVSGGWQVGNTDVASVPVIDTPGASNACDVCGNGILEAGEQCDDNGSSPTCDSDCTIPACGDGVFNAAFGEQCDDAGDSPMCDSDCTLAACGDGFVNDVAGETCDDGGRTERCDADCTAPTCGDGLVNATAGEQCDGDGAGTPGETEACDVDCTMPMCGDGVANAAAGEQCDDVGDSETCDIDCTPAVCGDGLTNTVAGEQCDSIGESSVCDLDCSWAVCGDGTLNVSDEEECDDGNEEDGDGCAADCTVEEEPTGTGDDGGLDDTSGGGEAPLDTTTTLATGSTGEDDTGTGGASVPDGGCSCSSPTGSGWRGTPWTGLTLLGLGAFRRRRRASSRAA